MVEEVVVVERAAEVVAPEKSESEFRAHMLVRAALGTATGHTMPICLESSSAGLFWPASISCRGATVPLAFAPGLRRGQGRTDGLYSDIVGGARSHPQS